MLYFGIVPTAAIFALPIFLGVAVVTAFAVGTWLSALNVQYRDVRYVIPFLTQFWFFATPIAYPSTLVPEAWQFLYGLNPMSGVVEGFRWALLGKANVSIHLLEVSTFVILFLLFGGLNYFKHMEKTIADVI